MMRRASTSIIRRLMFWLTVVIMVTSVAVTGIVAVVARRNADTNLAKAISESTDRLARMLEVPLWDVDLDRAQRLADAFASDPRVVRVTIRESVSGTTRVIERSATTDTAFRRLPVLHNGQEVGEVGLAFDRHVFFAAVWRDVAVGGAVATFALIMSLLGMRLMLRHLLERPLGELSAVVSSYAAGHYDRPAQPIGYGELQAFGEVLDSMGSRIVSQLNDLQQSNRELAALNAVLRSAAQEAEPSAILACACDELAALLAMPYAVAGVASEAGTSVSVIAERMPPGEDSAIGLVLRASDPAAQSFLATTEPVISDNAVEDPRLAFVKPLLAERRAQAWLALPLTSDGIAFGGIALFSPERRQFSEHELSLARRIVAQVAVALARHRARSAERLLRATIEQIPEAVFVTDADARIVFVNPAFASMNGVAREGALGRRAADVIRHARGTLPYADVQSSIARGVQWTGRVVIEREGAAPVTCAAVISPVRDAHGTVTHHVGIMRDITRTLEREERMRHSQKLEAVGQLAGGIAHDFNNILGAIMLQLEFLEMQLDEPEGAQQTIRELRASADRAGKLPRQLLVFSRRQSMDAGTHDLNVVVAELLRMLRRLIGERYTIVFTPEEESLAFLGDSGMIGQVVMNLCVNARDAMERGGRIALTAKRVTFGSDDLASHPMGRTGTFARLDVTDAGTGMTPEVLSHIFEPFFTTKPSGRGTGLGLATTHGIVTQHQGWIEVDTAVSRGTTFSVFIPVIESSSLVIGAEDDRRIETGDACILVVEDEEVIRRIVVRALREIGYRVLEAAHAFEARRIWHSSRSDIDLMLTDMVMPEGVSGLELTSQFRQDKPGLKVVVMSGYNLDVMDDEAAKPLQVHFIKKPFNLAVLSRTVRAALTTQVEAVASVTRA